MDREEIYIIFERYKNIIEQAISKRTLPHDILHEFNRLDDATITEADRRKAGRCDLGIYKYFKNFDDKYVMEIFVTHWDRCKTMQVRPDGNRVSIFLYENEKDELAKESFTFFDEK